VINGFIRTVVLNGFPSQCDGAGGFLADPEQGFENIRPFCTDQTGDTEDKPWPWSPLD